MAFDTSKIRLLVEETSREDAERFAEIVPPVDPGEARNLPPKVLLSGMSPVKDQGKGYYCASFATVALLEFKFPAKDLAECSLIQNTKQSIGDSMNFALQRGVCGESGWPYDFQHAGTKPCADRGGGTSFSFGKTFLLYQEKASRAGPKSDQTRLHLATVATPVIIDLPALFAPDWQCGWEEGDVFCPKMLDRDKAFKWADKNKSWHAVAVNGYDDAKQTFTFKNSWGTQWGHIGYGTLSYLYVDELSRIGMAAQ